jgi:hypothetical protein
MSLNRKTMSMMSEKLQLTGKSPVKNDGKALVALKKYVFIEQC